MSWFESVVDAVPGVGTAYRATRAVAAHVTGDHDEASRQWAEAGTNAAGDALGLVTGGAGKVAMVGGKAAVKAVAKQGVKAAVRAGGKAAMKQLSASAMKSYAKQYFKKEIKREVKRILKQKMEEYLASAAEYIEQHREDIIRTLADAIGVSRRELQQLSDQELINLVYTAINY